MRVKFRLEPDNTVTVLQEDQDTTISIENDGEDKVIIIDIEDLEPIIDVRLPAGAED